MESETDAPPVSAISLEGHQVRLRPISHADYGFLWECRSHPEILHLWTQSRTLPTFEQFAEQVDTMLAGLALTMLLIETRSNAEPIGFVFAYDYNPFDKYVFWSIALHPAYTNIGWGAEASVLFWNYLFTYFDLHKICSEHFTFNERSIKLLRRFGAREEGRFKAQRYYQGAYHDVVRLAGTRAEWDRVKQRAIRLFAP